jgi:hypothetical protein
MQGLSIGQLRTVNQDRQMQVNWQFPSEGQIPKPMRHSGKTAVYPSGRERGSLINEPCEASKPSRGIL